MRMWHWIEGVEELGAGYVFDGTDLIVHIQTDHYEGAGTIAVPPKVIAYAYDDKFALVSSKDSCSGAVVYWLILKTEPSTQQAIVKVGFPSGPAWASACIPPSHYKFSNVLGPMTQATFSEARTQYAVPAELGL
ncbi:MAG: hypothetical protein QM778_05005 [Myxococcales bacterium]